MTWIKIYINKELIDPIIDGDYQLIVLDDDFEAVYQVTKIKKEWE
jgi:hypothetical protein